MNKHRIKGGIIPAVTAMALSTCSCITAYAYEAPKNMELSIGTVEINREDLHGDTRVEVPVYIQNNPGIISVKMLFELDSGLKYEQYREASTDEAAVESVIIYNCAGTDRIISVDFTASGSNKFYTNGQLGVLSIIVPENAAAGRYSIRFTNGYDDEYLTVLTENDNGAEFGSECFSKLETGYIIIKEPGVPVPPAQPQEPVQTPQTQNNDPAPSQDQQTASGGTASGGEETPQETTVSATTETATETTSTTTSAKNTTTSETTTKMTETASTESESNYSSTTTSAETATAEKRNGKRVNNKVIIPAAVAAVIAAGVSTGFIVRKKRGKNNE